MILEHNGSYRPDGFRELLKNYGLENADREMIMQAEFMAVVTHLCSGYRVERYKDLASDRKAGKVELKPVEPELAVTACVVLDSILRCPGIKKSEIPLRMMSFGEEILYNFPREDLPLVQQQA